MWVGFNSKIIIEDSLYIVSYLTPINESLACKSVIYATTQ